MLSQGIDPSLDRVPDLDGKVVHEQLGMGTDLDRLSLGWGRLGAASHPQEQDQQH